MISFSLGRVIKPDRLKFEFKITVAICNSVTALKIPRTSISLDGSEIKHLTTNQSINQSINQFRLCSHESGQLFVASRKAVRYSVNSNGPRRHKLFTHIEHGAGAVC